MSTSPKTSCQPLWALLLCSSLGLACSEATPAPTTEPDADAPTADSASDADADSGLEVADLGPELPPPCPLGHPCDDGDPCTVDDTCDGAGGCAGGPLDCDDGLDCTKDTCDGGACMNTLATGQCVAEGPTPTCVGQHLPQPGNACVLCRHEAGAEASWDPVADGAPCSDGDACTTGDGCYQGECIPTGALTCESDEVCIDAACDQQLGCVTTPNTAPCDDGDPCTVGDGCQDGSCVAGAEALACDDGDPCTVDACEPGVGCVVLDQGTCDDGDPCTEDTCAADGSCTNTPFSGPCEDGDACTVGEVCADGVCGGGEPIDCDDADPCTEDACAAETGCQYYFADDTPCDDGFECTIDDLCVAGSCLGTKAGCDYCKEPVTDHAAKVVQLDVAADGNPGSGLDVDDDPDTCAPAGACAGGVDNALSILAALLNDPFQDAIVGGALFYVVDFDQATFDGAPFPFAIYDCSLGWSSWLDDCDWMTATCEYEANQLAFNAACEPYVLFDDAAIVDGTLTAGGPDVLITMLLPLAGASVPLTMARAKVSGTVTIDPETQQITQVLGIIAGAVPKSQLMALVDAVDYALLPVDKETIIELLESVVEDDIDLDGDGVFDAASVGLRFNTIGAKLVED